MYLLKDVIEDALTERGFVANDKQVESVYNRCVGENLTIDAAIKAAEDELINENPNVVVLGIDWDDDSNDSFLPRNLGIPFENLYEEGCDALDVDRVTEYLTDEYFCVINGIETIRYEEVAA